MGYILTPATSGEYVFGVPTLADLRGLAPAGLGQRWPLGTFRLYALRLWAQHPLRLSRDHFQGALSGICKLEIFKSAGRPWQLWKSVPIGANSGRTAMHIKTI